MKSKNKGWLTFSLGAVIMAVCYAFAVIRGEENFTELSAMLVAAAAHELGHVLAARVLRLPLGGIRLDILGARISTASSVSYFDEWMLSAGGPAFNLITAASFMPLCESSEWINLFIYSSLGFASLNLLPVDTFDGGRMLFCFLSSFTDGDLPRRALRFLSFFFVFLMWLVSVYLLMRIGKSLSLFVFSACLFSKLLDE